MFQDKDLSEAPRCEDMMQDHVLIDGSLDILRNALEENFAPKGFLDRGLGVGEAIQTFVENGPSFDMKKLI